MWRPKEKYKNQITITFTKEQWEMVERDCLEFLEKYFEKVEE